jgi:uncharacterized membrane protein YbhN (UPF0104 family)
MIIIKHKNKKGINILIAYIFSIAPVVLFIICCFHFKNDTQIKIAAVLSSLYGIAMVFIIIGSVSRIISNFSLNPSNTKNSNH